MFNINFVNKLNYNVFSTNVTSLGLFGSYSNTLLYNLWDRDQRINTERCCYYSYIANPLIFSFLVATTEDFF